MCCASSRRPTRSSTPGRGGGPPRLRLRRRRLCGRRGARGALRPRQDALRCYPRLRAVPQRWVLVDAAPKILAEIPTRLGDYAAKELSAAASRSTSRRCSRRSTATEAVLSNGDADPGADARLDRRRQGEPARRRVRAAPRRARTRPRRLVPARRGTRAHLVARRLRRRAEHADARHVRPADVPARAPPGAAAREEPRRRAGASTATGCSARSRRSAATRASPTSWALRFRGFPGWFITRSYHLYQLPLLPRKLRVVDDWTTSLFFRRDIAELSLPHPPEPPRRVTTGGVRSTTAAISSSVSSAPRDQASANTVSPSAARSACTVES